VSAVPPYICSCSPASGSILLVKVKAKRYLPNGVVIAKSCVAQTRSLKSAQILAYLGRIRHLSGARFFVISVLQNIGK
jgi:hypothetical protein